MSEESLTIAVLDRLLQYSPAIVVCVACVFVLAECIKELIKLKEKK